MHWGTLLNAIFWNLEGWDCISTCSGNIDEPIERIIPRGLFMSLAFTSTQYIAVLSVAAGLGSVGKPWYDWHDGSLASIAGDAMGPLMSIALLAASVVGNAGMYLSQFIETAYLLSGAAEIGIIPRAFSRQLPRTEAPIVSIAFQWAIISMMVVCDFSDILVFDNFFSGMAVLLEFVAFFVLRRRRPDLARPYRVPTAALLLFVPALGFLGAMIYHCFTKSSKTAVLTCLAFAVGLPYGLWVAARERKNRQNGLGSALDELLE